MGTISLWKHQQEASDFLVNSKRVILGDKMGVGKTRPTLDALERTGTLEGRVLIVCTNNAMLTWQQNIEEFFPGLPITLIQGANRDKLWSTAASQPGIYMTNPNLVMRDALKLPKTWDAIITDEYHRFMINRSNTYKVIKSLRSPYLFQLTGSPMRKGAQDFWPALNTINPKKFSSYWRWVNTFCHVDENPFGKQIYGVSDSQALAEALEGHYLSRTKDEVLPHMPKKVRARLPVKLTRDQQRIYNSLKKEMLAILDSGDIILAATAMEKYIRLRQLLIMPKILDPSLDYGAGMEGIIEKIQDSDPHCVIFTPYTAAIPFIKERLEVEGLAPVILQGGLSLEELKERLTIFRETRCPAIVSIAYAQSFDMHTSSYAYFLGYMGNPGDNEQAEDRLHRGDITSPVNIWYVENQNTVDQGLLESINERNQDVTNLHKTIKGLKELLGG